MKTITCREAVDIILKKEEGKTSFLQRLALWRHLAICSLCKIFQKQNQLINEAFKEKHKKNFKLSNEEKENIIRNVLEEDRK